MKNIVQQQCPSKGFLCSEYKRDLLQIHSFFVHVLSFSEKDHDQQQHIKLDRSFSLNAYLVNVLDAISSY